MACWKGSKILPIFKIFIFHYAITPQLPGPDPINKLRVFFRAELSQPFF
jgi:hypothetical protein